MAREVFIDTSGFYALLVKKDDRHRQASDFMRDAARKRLRFVTTDYVPDETATLLQAHGHIQTLNPFFASAFESRVCRVMWTDADLFGKAKALFLRRLGQGWSFTDCVSVVVMKNLRLSEVLTKDSHFGEAGFTVLLPQNG
jgi:predicted nucleic acid-binding protein